MEIGIFAKTWTRYKQMEEIFKEAQNQGIKSFQFNMCVAGQQTLPDIYDPHLIDKIFCLSKKYNIKLAAMSGTFNLLDDERFEENLKKAEYLMQACEEIRIPVLTLCTGTRSKESMWTWHPENGTEEVWNIMKEKLDKLISVAEKYKIILGIEPEISNVVSSPQRARKLLEEMGTPVLKIIMDAANLFLPGEKVSNEKIKEAVDLLKEDIVLVHAKDCVISGEKIFYRAAGKGQIDFEYYIKCLKKIRYGGSVILHGLPEDEISYSVNFLRKWIE